MLPTRIRPGSEAPQRWRTLLGLTFVAGAVFASSLFLGWTRGAPQAAAAPPAPNQLPVPESSPEYSRRVVAYIHGNIPITREELGEYLIARYGADKLELLVNKRIIEKACREKGIEVTAAEVKAALDKDCAQIGVSRELFLSKVLKERKVSLYEWEEDVLKPQLLLAKLCRDRVQVTEDDLRMAFEAYHGEKIEVRIILMPNTPNDRKIMVRLYEKVRSSEDEFIKAAREQPDPNLAAQAGLIKPIHRHMGGDEVEKAAFRLQPGDVSEMVETPGGLVIMKCLKRLPPDRTKIFENEKEALTKEVFEKKALAEVRVYFADLKKQADAKVFLKHVETMAELERSVQEELKNDPKVNRPPTGN